MGRGRPRVRDMDGASQPDEGEARPSGAAVRPRAANPRGGARHSRMAPAWSFRRRAHVAISDNTISKLLRELAIDNAVPHGFRSSFRDWAAECSDAPSRGLRTRPGACEFGPGRGRLSPDRPVRAAAGADGRNGRGSSGDRLKAARIKLGGRSCLRRSSRRPATRGRSRASAGVKVESVVPSGGLARVIGDRGFDGDERITHYLRIL